MSGIGYGDGKKKISSFSKVYKFPLDTKTRISLSHSCVRYRDKVVGVIFFMDNL